MTDEAKRLAEIRERVEKATPGPWEWTADRWRGGYSGLSNDAGAEIVYPQTANDGDTGAAWFEEMAEDDAALIAHARADIPFLLAEIERLTAARDAAYADGAKDMREKCAEIAAQYADCEME